MSRFRTPMAGLAGLALLFLGAAVPAAADPTERAEDLAVVTLLNINDFHGRIASAPDSDSGANTLSLAAVIDRLRQSAGPANAVLLSAGDNVGASLFASAVQDDQPTLDVLNTLGLAASAVGNHEFDRGWDDLSGRLEEAADFPYLGANVYAKGTKNPALQEFAVVEAAGLRVAVIGAVTQETPTLVSPAGVAAIDFGDPVEAVNRVADRIKAENLADIIVAEYHDGAPAGSPEGATLEQEIAVSATFAHIVEDTAASVDVIFTAHTHKAYAWEAAVPGTDKTRPVLQTGCYGANLGVVSLSYDKTAGTVVSHSQTNVKAAATEPDPNDPAAQLPVPTEAETAASPTLTRVKAIVDAAMANAQAVGSQKVGAVTADITRAAAGGTYSADGVYSGGALDDRAEASTLGRLVGNALRDTLQAIDADVDFGVVNPGGLRADLSYAAHDGDITFEQLLSVLPFNNNLSIVSLTGRQVTEMLAEQWQRDADGNLPTRPYLELGLSDDVAYAYTETAETCTAAAAGNASVPCQKGSIINVTLRGEPIDPEAVYKIATFNFLAAGGDNFWVFQEASKVVDTGLLDWEGWVDYIRAASADGPIQPDYSRSSVRLEGLPDTLTSVDQVTLQVSKLNVMSLGAVGARQLDVSLGGVDLGRFPVVDGAATVSFTPPEEAAGWPVLAFSAQPNGTYVSFPVRFSAAPVTPVVPALVLSAETVAAGETLTLQVTGGTAGEAVEAWLGADGPLIAEGVLDAAGAADLAAVIPADTAPGDYDVEVTGADGLLLRAGLTVTAAPADADALPASGSSTPLPLLWAALAALAIGAGCGVGSHATRRAGAATRH